MPMTETQIHGCHHVGERSMSAYSFAGDTNVQNSRENIFPSGASGAAPCWIPCSSSIAFLLQVKGRQGLSRPRSRTLESIRKRPFGHQVIYAVPENIRD